MIMNDELEMMWKQAVVAQFNALSRNLPAGTEGITKISVRIAGAQADIRTGDLPNASRNRCCLSQLAPFSALRSGRSLQE